jgi:hypothetical protein
MEPITITTTEQKIFYLSDDILKLSLNFCDEIASKIEVQFQSYCEIFKNATMHSSTTKDEFILFFNIIYTQFYVIQIAKKTNNSISLKAFKAKTLKVCKDAVESIRKTVIRAFLDVYYVVDGDEKNPNIKENLISINNWFQNDFEGHNFKRLKFDDSKGFQIIVK